MSWLVAFIAQELGLATRAQTRSSHPIRSFTWPLCTLHLPHVGDTFLNRIRVSVRPCLPRVFRWQPTQELLNHNTNLPVSCYVLTRELQGSLRVRYIPVHGLPTMKPSIPERSIRVLRRQAKHHGL